VKRISKGLMRVAEFTTSGNAAMTNNEVFTMLKDFA
jgi:hypothetical protein